MATPTSQGSSVSFDGQVLGRLTTFRASGGVASFEDITNASSSVVGSSENTRVLRQYDCVAVDPGTVDVGLFGCPPYVTTDIGHHANVSVAFEGGALSFGAYLENFEVTGQVGEFLVGTARFRISGTPEGGS